VEKEKTKKGEVTRLAIEDAAISLFLEHGYHATSMRQIADQAGLALGGIYNHFKSKEALAAEILTAYAKGTQGRNLFTDPKLPALARLKKLFAALNEYFFRHYEGCMIGKFMAEVSDDTPLIRGSLVGVLNLWDEKIAPIIRDGQKQGSIRKDLKADELATFLFDSYEGAILRMRVEQSPRALKAFVKIVFASIAA
jgi:TetR/AcrR family transcriptional repressor of nem operon